MSFEGISTQYAYNNDFTAGEAAGEVITTTDGLGNTLRTKKDVFGKSIWHTDLGNRRYDYTYNAAGWLTKQVSSAGQDIDYSYYNNGFQKSITDNTINSLTEYQYDVNGNKLAEKYSNTLTDEVFQDTSVQYDELNRTTTIIDASAKFNIQYEYDSLGNKM